MSAAKIQADYDQLGQIAAQLAKEAGQTLNLFQALKGITASLTGGGWVGEGAESYAREMEELIFPALNRLGHALEDAGSASKKIADVFHQGEDEASGLFGGEGAGVTSGGAGGNLMSESLSGGSSSGGGASGGSGVFAALAGSNNTYFKPGGATPTSHWTRNDAYMEMMAEIKKLPGPGGQVKFFDAAERVTSSRMLGGTSWTPDFVISQETFAFTNKVGEDLYTFNAANAAKVMNDPYNLTDPNGTGKPMGSALDHDLHYVHAEQSRVESFIKSETAAGRLNSSNIAELNDAMNGSSSSSTARNLFYKAISPVADTGATDWAKGLTGGSIDFGNQSHREAIGKAAVFQAHGYSQADYMNYMRTGKMP